MLSRICFFFNNFEKIGEIGKTYDIMYTEVVLMRLLVLDGNSIFNRAFYGIKLLTTKDGRYTNAVYGFMNILLRLNDEVKPDAVAIAFDLKAPTFRHKMYSGYKANRKGMPTELAEQMPVLKQLLTALGYKLVECEGWEADDILGTLAGACGGNECFIATGDRDSLQLVDDKVTVLLASTKMGRPETKHYNTEKIKLDYGVEPQRLIDIKALMGDSSDCIPGVAGIGQKTAADLVARFGALEDIYAGLDSLDIKQGVRDKLAADRDMAFLSKTLGTISREAPIDTDYSVYVPSQPDAYEVTRILSDLEMYKMIDRLNLGSVPAPKRDELAAEPEISCERFVHDSPAHLLKVLEKAGKAYFAFSDGTFLFALDKGVGEVNSGCEGYEKFCEDFLFDKSIAKYSYNIKPLYAFAIRNDCELNGVCADAMLSAYVLNPSSGAYSQDRLLQEYLGIAAGENADTAAVFAAHLPELSDKLAVLAADNGQTALIADIELPLAKVLADMETEGFEVDADGISDFGVMLAGRIASLTKEIYEQVGYEFNLNSPKQLGDALFVKLGLPGGKKTKNGYSTNADALERLAAENPVVAQILEYRSLSKLKATYCDGLIREIEQDGRIHSNLNQTETRTGRISSTEPNLQNIPIRTPLGKEMRRFFRAKEGCVLVDADYSQIELRVLAHIANDKAMIEAFNNNDDIHAITASQVFNMPLMMVTPLMRSRAKAVNFGIVYGIGAFSLAKDIGVTRAEADSYIKGYLNHFSGVKKYMGEIIEKAKKQGYVETLFARRRYLPELSSSNGMLRAFGERVALNMPIQGTAADIIKIAMVRVHESLREQGLGAKLILQVHDELIVEAPMNEEKAVCAIVRREMENAAQMRVKLETDISSGKTWYDAK